MIASLLKYSFRFFVLKIFFFNCTLIFSQIEKKPNWVENPNSISEIYKLDSFFVFQHSIPCPDEKSFLTQEKQINNILIQKLAGTIQTSISSVTNNSTYQVNSNNKSLFQSTYQNKSELIVKVDFLPYEIPLIWPKKFIKSEKKIYGLIAVSKSKLKTALKGIIDVNISTLEMRFISSPKHKTNNELIHSIAEADEQIEGILNNISLIKYLEPGFEDYLIFNRLNEINKNIENYRSTLSNKEFENIYLQAKTYLDDNKCYKAFNEFKSLARINSSDIRVSDGLIFSLACVNKKIQVNLAQQISEKNYEKAICLYDSLILLNPQDRLLHEIGRYEIIQNYIAQKFVEIDGLIESNIWEARKIVNSIQVFGTSEFNEKIEEYRNRINAESYKIRVLEFKNSINQRDFVNANKQIIILGKENAGMDNISSKLSDLGKSLNKASYSFEKTKLLRSRPNLYCAQVGISLSSEFLNQSDFNTVQDFKDIIVLLKPIFNTITPTYFFNIYRKININEQFSKKYKDRSKSDLIGLKIGYTDFNNVFETKKDSILFIPSDYQYTYSLQVSSLLFHRLNLNYGINSKSYQNFRLNDIYFITSFGIKIPIGNFQLDINTSYLTDYDTKHNFVIESSLSYNINFIKKYNQQDKISVRYNSQQWRK